jgi:hypothetical protein
MIAVILLVNRLFPGIGSPYYAGRAAQRKLIFVPEEEPHFLQQIRKKR